MTLTGRFKIKAIKKKTSAIFFRDLKVGDEFELRYNLSGHYNSAPTIYIYVDGEYIHNNNSLQLSRTIEKFEIEKIS